MGLNLTGKFKNIYGKSYKQFENEDEEDAEDAAITVSNPPGGQYKTYMMNSMTGSTPKELSKEEMANGTINHLQLGQGQKGQTPQPNNPNNPFYQANDQGHTVRHIRYERDSKDSVEDDTDFQSYRWN